MKWLGRSLTAAVLATTVALGAETFAPTPVAAATTINTMSFNVCGVKCRHGEVTRTAAYIAGKAVDLRMSVGFLQEICFSQYKQVQRLLARKGYSMMFAPQTSAGKCDDADRSGGHGFGVAIFAKGKLYGRSVLQLPVPPGHEGRVLLSGTTMLGGRSTFVAVTHTSTTARTGRTLQLSRLSTFLNAKAGSRPTLVGGDFNTTPDDPQMKRFYSAAVGGTGRFTELDQLHTRRSSRSGAATFSAGGVQRKIDYIFASRSHFRDTRATAGNTVMSDHHLYWGSVRTG